MGCALTTEPKRTVHFWGAESPFSNFHDAGEPVRMWIEFAPDVRRYYTFKTAEHAFVFCKATYFADNNVARKVQWEETPGGAQSLERDIEGFDEERWRGVRWDIMFACVLAKFGGNSKLWDLLKDNGDVSYVATSSFDRVWGMGYHAEGPEPGLNLLGKILGAVYQRLVDDRPSTVDERTLKIHAL